MSRVLRMNPTTFWWENHYDQAAHLGYVRLTCEEPTADAWEVKFPRFQVAYGGWCASRNMRLAVEGIAERTVAEQIRQRILTSTREQSTFDGLWAEVRDLGRAPHEAFDTGAEFWATAGSRSGQRGSIAIRNRYDAAVQWEGEPFTGGTTYALDLMSATRPVHRHIPHSMGWLKGR